MNYKLTNSEYEKFKQYFKAENKITTFLAIITKFFAYAPLLIFIIQLPQQISNKDDYGSNLQMYIIIFFEIIGLLMLSFIIGKFASLIRRSGSHISLEKLEKGNYYCREYKALEDYYVYTGDIKEKIGNRVHKVSFINEYGKEIESEYIGKDNIGGMNIIVVGIPIKKDDDIFEKCYLVAIDKE